MPNDDSFLSRQSTLRLADSNGQSGFYLLNSGQDAFLSRAALVESAEQSIDAQYYIWSNDVSGRYLAGRLLLAADRGVRVRLLLDDFNAESIGELFAALDTHPGIHIRIFNPARSRSGWGRWVSFLMNFDRINRRMHSKTSWWMVLQALWAVAISVMSISDLLRNAISGTVMCSP